MTSRPVFAQDRASARGRVAPAAGCFGLRQPIEGHDDDTHQPSPDETSDRERFAKRFAVIDYGDGQAPVRAAPRTS